MANIKPRTIELRKKLKELHHLKLSDVQLGKIFNLNYRTISFHRKAIGLSPSMPENNYISNRDRVKGYIIRNTKFMAKRRGINFNLTFEDFDLPEYCPILNIKLTFGKESSGNHFSHASLDRIDNSKGYIKGNVIVMSRMANAMKNSANFEQLETFSSNILKLVNHYKTQDALANITDVFPHIKLKT
jgi:hypothetical protein